jgi:uncharacterized protein YpiB (UPF0302 family)
MNRNDQDQKRELMIVINQTDTTEYEFAAQLILDKAITMFQLDRLEKQIDEALSTRDKDRFMELSFQYKELLKKFKEIIDKTQ